MRLPPISRSHTSGLTRGRWVFAPNWRVFSRRHEYRSSQAVAIAQKPLFCQTPEVIIPSRASYQRSELSKLPGANPKPYPNKRTSPIILLRDALYLYHNPAAPLSESKLARLRYLALDDTTRLAVITAQQILREIPELDPRVGDLLCCNAAWSARLHRLVSKGLTTEDISYWAWTLVPRNPDKRVARFMSRPCYKPPFVLSFLLLKTVQLRPDSLEALLEYCRKWYSGQQTGRDVVEAFDLYSALDPWVFNSMAEKLCFHASKLRPDSLPDIADLSVAYIKGIPHSCQHPDKAYKLQCLVFNSALQAVSLPSKKSPYKQASQNWRAVTILLSLSSSLERPLIIEEESYRAIRQILLALPKTSSERDTASALSSSWPPYRILRDGMEEKADTREYLSRAVKAGFMMQEAGYSKKEVDVIMDVLGGMAPDGSPTIQTRTNYPRHLRADQGTWAALVRATRNAQEAWAAFKDPPEHGMRPTFEVYWELMVKLAAAPADPGHHNLPGDGREVFPFDDINFSDFEKARISPPSIPQLIEQMFNAGVAIQGRTLAWLLRQAPDVETALEYINHSRIDDSLKTILKWWLKNYRHPTTSDPPTELSRHVDLPHELLHATVDLLCRLQPNRTANTPDSLPRSKLRPIHHAMRLAQFGRTFIPASDRAPWESIMLALGRPNIMVSNTAPRDNNIQVVKMALKVLEKAEEHGALSLDMLDSFGQAIRKAVYSSLSILLEHTSCTSAMLPEDEEFMSLYRVQSTELMIPNGPHVFRGPDAADNTTVHPPFFKGQQGYKLQTPYNLVREASARLKAAWRVLSTNVSAHRPCIDSRVMAMHIYGHMRTLAAIGDLEEAVLLLFWVVRDWAPTAEDGLSPADVRRLSKAAIVFRAFVEPLLDEGVVASLREEIETHSEKGGPVHWPTDQDVEEYIQGDSWGSQQNLHEVVKCAAASKQDHRLSGASER